MIRTARRLGIGAVAALVGVVVLPGVASASTAAVNVTRLDGSPLAVGDVIATGTLGSDGFCSFDSGISGVVLHGTGTAATTVDNDCLMRLVSIGDGAGSLGAGTPGYRPKVWDTGTVSAPMSGTVIGDVGVDVGGNIAGDVFAEVAGAATGSHKYAATASQTIYDATGTWLYEDNVVVDYVQRKSDGRISGAVPSYGYCAGNPYTVLTIQEVRACWFKMPYAGPTNLEFTSGGTYRQIVLGVETDFRKIHETFFTSTTGRFGGSCNNGGNLKPGWTTYCYIDRN